MNIQHSIDSEQYRIPAGAIYRVYGDTLGVLINTESMSVTLLQGEALGLWRQIISPEIFSVPSGKSPVLEELLGSGALAHGDAPERGSAVKEKTAVPPDEIDSSLFQYWAFKNHVPVSGHFELTGRCNLRCKHCYCLFENKRDTLSTEQVINIIDDLYESGTFSLVLTGGEIFFRPDIMDILEHLNRRQFLLRLNTNGTLLTEKHVRQLEGYENIYRTHISLYGHTAEIHDRITGSTGSFAKTMNTINMLSEAGMRMRINCSVMNYNYESYKFIRTEIGDPLGIPVHFDSAIFPKDDGSTDNQQVMLDNEKQLEMMRYVKEDKSYKFDTPKVRKLCKAGFAFFSICEDGSLYPCLKMKRYYKRPLGNLCDSSMKDIWRGSQDVLRIRKELGRALETCDICELKI